jgi:hypothetical protein
MKRLVVIGMVLFCLPSPLSAQTGTDETDKVKMVSAEFTKALLVNKDIDSAVKLAAVPFSQGWSRPDPKTSDTTEDLKKHLRALSAGVKATYMGDLKIIKIETYEEYRAGLNDNPKLKEVYDRLMQKSDRVVLGSLNSKEGVTAGCHIMVARPKGQIKVVGFEVIHFAPKAP